MNNTNQNDKSQLDKRLLELTALFEISRSLTATLNLNAILDNILRIPMGHMLISKGIVLIRKTDGDQFTIEGLKGFERKLLGKSISIDSPPSRAVAIEEIEEDAPYGDFFVQFGVQLIVPLISTQSVIGLVCYGSKINGEEYEENELEFLDSLSNIAAAMVNNALMVEEIKSVNRQLDRKVQQLNTIFDISRELNTTLKCEKIGSLLSFAVMGELLVNKCVIFVREGAEMCLLVAKGSDSKLLEDAIIREMDSPVFVDQQKNYTKFKEAGIALLVPMRIQDETKGILALGAKITGHRFSGNDLEFLTTLGNQAMTSLENARLFEEMIEKQRMEEELNLARSIQQGLLPSQLPDVPGCDIAALNIPSRQVGGDYYDVIQLEDHKFAIAIADVAGKGAGAALLMSNLQASLHALSSADLPIEEIVCRINRLIFQNTGLDKFITFFYAELDTIKGELTYCNAGHNPPYRIDKNGKVEELTVGGIVIGMMDNMQFESATLKFNAGDQIVMFTDGITEAMNPDEEEYGEAKLVDCIRSNLSEDAHGMINRITESVNRFSEPEPQADDMTLVVISFHKECVLE